MSKKSKVKSWIKASRPHTLPLALACIGFGNFVAYVSGQFSVTILILSFLTAILLQVLSNFANDYGDTKHGADSEERIGPKRTLQTGEISKKQMQRAIVFIASLSFASGIFLLINSYPNIGLLSTIVYMLIGVSAIWAAYSYTASDKPYGYRGMGDVFVFLFFGVAAVFGSFFLQTGAFNILAVYASIAMGLLSVAVLNLNNIRDIDSDKASNKITIAVMLGSFKAKIYHSFLIFVPVVLFVIMASKIYSQNIQFLFLLPMFSLIFNVVKTFIVSSKKEYYPLLKQLTLSVFFSVLIFMLGLILI